MPSTIGANLTANSFSSIGILATPKTGNLWLRFCLERGLHLISSPASTDEEIASLVRSLLDDPARRPFIFHAHHEYTEARRRLLMDAGISLITLLRHPVDIFLSLRRHHRRIGSRGWPDEMLLDDGATETYLNNVFPALLGLSASWVRSGVASILRYEDLVAAPRSTFQHLLDPLRPGQDHAPHATFMARIGTLETLKEIAKAGTENHFPVGQADQWRWEENSAILSMFQRNHALAEIVREWGYSLDPAESRTRANALSDQDLESPEPDFLEGIESFDEGSPFSAHLKIIFYFHQSHGTGRFDFGRPGATDDGSFFRWLTQPCEEASNHLNNLEYETLRFRCDVQKAFTPSHGFEINSFRQWLHVHGARDLNLSHKLLQNTAFSMGRLTKP